MNIRRSLLKVLGLTAILSQITVFSVSAADTVKVGILLPLSGSVAPIGVNNRRGHEFAVEEINANGGIKALGGAKLEMIDGDTQGKPEIGITELQKLERKGVVAIMGAYQSGVTFPVTQVSEKLRVPFIAVSYTHLTLPTKRIV